MKKLISCALMVLVLCSGNLNILAVNAKINKIVFKLSESEKFEIEKEAEVKFCLEHIGFVKNLAEDVDEEDFKKDDVFVEAHLQTFKRGDLEKKMFDEKNLDLLEKLIEQGAEAPENFLQKYREKLVSLSWIVNALNIGIYEKALISFFLKKPETFTSEATRDKEMRRQNKQRLKLTGKVLDLSVLPPEMEKRFKDYKNAYEKAHTPKFKKRCLVFGRF